MNHTSIVQHESERHYRNRSYVLGKIDQGHIDAVKNVGEVHPINGYCLDALDYTPAGGMYSDSLASMRLGRVRNRAGQQLTCERGVTLEAVREREALAERLIAEILADEKRI